MTGIVITYKITEFWGASANPATITLPVPNTSSGSPGRASFDTGFPLACFQSIDSGGTPPSGEDFNGGLYMLSQYAAAMQSGQAIVGYDAGTSTALGGYPKNAILSKATGVGFWVSTVDANTSDPDTAGSNWQDFSITPSGSVSDAPTAGAHNDYAPTGYGPTTGFLELTAGGAANITGLAAGYNGQTVIISCLGSNAITLNALNTGSAAANRFRLPGDLVMLPNQAQAFRYETAVALWIGI